MKTRYRLIRRGIRGNKFYCVDTSTGKRTSLGTANEDDAKQVVAAKNNSERQPVLNLQIAKAYLAGSDTGMTTRTWQNAIESLIGTKQGANQHRWKTAAKDKALAVTHFFDVVRMAKLASQGFRSFGRTGIAFCGRIAAL